MSYRKYLMTDDVPPSELYKTVKIGTDSDTISRQAAITALSNEIVKRRLLDEMYDGCIDEFQTEEILKKLPPAQPEQLEQCPIYGGMCAYPSDQCYDCPRHAGAKMEVTT